MKNPFPIASIIAVSLVVDGVVQQLPAVAERARRARVVLEVVEHRRLAHRLRDPVRGGLEEVLGKVRRAPARSRTSRGSPRAGRRT
jgi:hypothetical protein